MVSIGISKVRKTENIVIFAKAEIHLYSLGEDACAGMTEMRGLWKNRVVSMGEVVHSKRKPCQLTWRILMARAPVKAGAGSR